MIDIHTHILPNVDDGTSSTQETKQLLLDAINENITDICITPHFSRIDEYTYKSDYLLEQFNTLKQECKDLPINLYLGNELMIDSHLDELLLENKLLTLNNSNYVLVEFPFDKYLADYDEYLYNISLNYKIIIAHPERYSYVQANPDKYINNWISNNYYIQVNQNGLFNHTQRKIIYKLIDNQNLHIICSDAHNINRPITLLQAYNHISNKYNKQLADILFNTNPYNVLNNKQLIKLPKVKRKLITL